MELEKIGRGAAEGLMVLLSFGVVAIYYRMAQEAARKSSGGFWETWILPLMGAVFAAGFTSMFDTQSYKGPLFVMAKWMVVFLVVWCVARVFAKKRNLVASDL